MTIELKKLVAPNVEMSAMSQGWLFNEPCILIPLSALDKLTDQEIAAGVRSMVDTAWLAAAISIADSVVQNCYGQPQVPEWWGREHTKDIELLEQHEGQDELIDQALALIRVTQRRIELKDKGEIKRKRQEIARNYDKLFLAIGRRDGFRCRHCGKSDGDLEIDHVVALINGGANDLDNLQLLCSACNRSKGCK